MRPAGRLLSVLALMLLCLRPGAAAAAEAEAERPRIALVLSGGGARGFAHIGVLRALRELKVPVDIVVGTSMGCVIGGAYAAGRSVEDLEQTVREIDWGRVLADRPPRDALTFRRRDEDINLPSRVEFGLDGQGLSLPPATAGNAELELALARLLPEGLQDRPADALPLPFRSVASDLVSGELVELADTPLLLAMRASLSLPGVFAPVRVKQRLLVDGGLVRNLPVDIARALGADVVIAVNVGTPLAPESELGSSFGVTQQMLRILTEQNVQRSLKELGPRDILIAPELAGLSFLDFAAHQRAIAAGAAATQRLAERLRALALPDDRYAALERSRQAGAAATGRALPLARVEVQGAERLNPQVLQARTGLQVGQATTPEQVRQAAARLYGRADIGRVETAIEDTDGQRNVTLTVSEAAWARSRLRLGLELSSDFGDDNSFGVVAMHVAPSLNAWGAELRTTARIGTRRLLTLEWWQPLGAGSDWYVAPVASYGGSSADLFDQGRRVGRASLNELQLALTLGHQFGDWGDLRLGLSRSAQRARQLLPDDPALAARFVGNSAFVQLRIDTLEPIAYPERGQFLLAQWSRLLGQDASAGRIQTSEAVALAAFGAGAWAGHVYVEWAQARQTLAPAALGGFLRLSGTDALSVSGSTVLFGRLLWARRIGELPPPFGAAIRAGLSLETGGGFAAGESPRLGALKQAGSAFVVLDTRFGPLYLGAGATRGGSGTLYLFLGPVW